MFVFLKYPLYEYQRLSFAESETFVFDNIEKYKVIRFLKLSEEDKKYIIVNIINNYDFIALCIADKQRMNNLTDKNEITFLNLYYSMRKEENDLLIKNIISHSLSYVLINRETNNMYIRFSTRKTYKSIVELLLETYNNNFNTYYKKTFIDKTKPVKQKEKEKEEIITENGKKFKIVKSKSGLTIKRPVN